MNPLQAIFGNGIRQARAAALSTRDRSLAQFLNLLLVISSALAIWKGLGIATNTESPIVVVLTESMEPAFARGDLLFLSLSSRPFAAGDIVVYKQEGKDIPIVHRVLNVHNNDKTGKQHMLTKGDNNQYDDRGIYQEHRAGQLWIRTEDVIGVVRGYAPYVGYGTIAMNENPLLKYCLLAALGFFALITRE
ncbi:Signal peptidase complex catalytic subunit [Sorochytrium milnesiophthora]